MPTPRYLLIANPGTKRCEIYCRELLTFWANRGVAPEVEVIPWADVVPRAGNIDGLPAFDRPGVVRLESPGKEERVTRLLLEAGAGDEAGEGIGSVERPFDWRAAAIPRGLLVRPGLYYRGFRRVLRGLRQAFDARPHLAPTACPLAIAEMFDKTATAAKLYAAGVPVPRWLDGNTMSPDVTVFPRQVHETGWPVVYVKLNTGSSATGIVVVYNPPDYHDMVGLTTLAEIDGEFYNTRRLRRLEGGWGHLIKPLCFLRYEGAIVQQGIPMAQIDGQNFDVRVVCIHGRPAAMIFRLSSGPMTNLHLGGRRGDFASCRAMIPTRDWLDALDHCADAAACFDSAIAGVDLLFERGFHRHYVLEVNAFGDFFPGWADGRGQSVHALEIEETSRKFA